MTGVKDLSPPFHHRYRTHFWNIDDCLDLFNRETMKTNDVRSNDIQRTNLTTVNDIFLTKIMKLEWPDKR